MADFPVSGEADNRHALTGGYRDFATRHLGSVIRDPRIAAAAAGYGYGQRLTEADLIDGSVDLRPPPRYGI